MLSFFYCYFYEQIFTLIVFWPALVIVSLSWLKMRARMCIVRASLNFITARLYIDSFARVSCQVFRLGNYSFFEIYEPVSVLFSPCSLNWISISIPISISRLISHQKVNLVFDFPFVCFIFTFILIFPFVFSGIYEVFCGHKNFYIGKQPEPLEGTDVVSDCLLRI